MRCFLLVCALAVIAGCPADEPPECKVVETECAPQYVPTFTNVYNNTIKDGCGSTSSNCHNASNPGGGLSFESQDVAYQALTDATKRRVVAGDPACSEMIVRTESPGEDYQMPPGDPLSEPARCALIQWVLEGAQP